MEPDSTAPPHRVFRSVATMRAAVLGTAIAIGCVVLAVVPGRAQIAGFVFAPLFLLMTWRVWNAGIHVESDGVKIVTVFLSRRVRWQDIDHFAVMPFGRYPYVGHVVLLDGRKLGTFGLATSSRRTEANRLRVQWPIDQLNRILAEQRPAAGQDG